jgi:hypothetical protein
MIYIIWHCHLQLLQIIVYSPSPLDLEVPEVPESGQIDILK